MDREHLPVTNPSIVFREEFDDWALLFDPDTGESYGVNPVGAFIWKELRGGKHLPNSSINCRQALMKCLKVLPKRSQHFSMSSSAKAMLVLK